MYNHFQTFQSQILCGMTIEIKDELNYNLNQCVLILFVVLYVQIIKKKKTLELKNLCLCLTPGKNTVDQQQAPKVPLILPQQPAVECSPTCTVHIVR